LGKQLIAEKQTLNMSKIIENIIEAVRSKTVNRQQEARQSDEQTNADIRTLSQYNLKKDALATGRENSSNFRDYMAGYSLDDLLPGVAVKIRQGTLPHEILPACMAQLAGVSVLENCRAKLIAAVEAECVTQIETELREFEKKNYAVLRRHGAI
jgi:hypothetical protein